MSRMASAWHPRQQRQQPMNWRDSIRASDNRHAQGHSQSVLALRSVEWTYSENKGYASNRRRFLTCVCWTQIISVCQKWPRRCLWTVQSGSRSSRTDRRPPSHPWRPSWSAPEWTCLTARRTRWSTLYCDLISPVSHIPENMRFDSESHSVGQYFTVF